jgi:5-bromo-4-chloroindolyl phosphate hydrolysis protein
VVEGQHGLVLCAFLIATFMGTIHKGSGQEEGSSLRQGRREEFSAASRRVGGGASMVGSPTYRWLPRGWALKIAAVAFTWPLVLALFRGAPADALALAAAMALLFTGGELVARGCREEAEREGRTLALSDMPWKTMGALAAGAAAFLISLGAAHDPTLMAVLFGVVTTGAVALTYGLDQRVDRRAIKEAAQRAGLRGKDVIETLEEAHRKVRGIEEAARGLHSRELKARLERICRQARGILGQLEQNPNKLSRARRFLVTYLDGTRDVVGRYAQQQKDLADTPLAGNFRNVLDTVEKVFAEQEEILRRDDQLNLEVQIEVLETQLRREGVH